MNPTRSYTVLSSSSQLPSRLLERYFNARKRHPVLGPRADVAIQQSDKQLLELQQLTESVGQTPSPSVASETLKLHGCNGVMLGCCVQLNPAQSSPFSQSFLSEKPQNNLTTRLHPHFNLCPGEPA